MLIKEFHDEAVLTAPPPAAEVAVGSDRATRATAISMLIRLLLNGWITDKEKLFLDNLPPGDCLAFLLRERTYIHPEGLQLFPLEMVESATMQAGEAIFSHLHRPQTAGDDGQPYRIFSAAINPADSEKIVLGFFGPEYRLGSFDEDNHFAKLVYSFREAYTLVSREIDKLREYLARDEATILINRTTGKVLTLNRAAAQLLSRSERALVDIGLDQFRYHLLPLLAQHNLKMDNITASDLGVSVVTFESSADPSEGESELLDYFAQRFSDNTSALILAIGELQQLTGGDDVRQLSRPIQSEAKRMQTTLEQFDLMRNYDNRIFIPQSVKQEVKRVIAGLPQHLVEGYPVSVNTDETEMVVEAPERALGMLLEELLMLQLTLTEEGTETMVMLHSPNSTEYKIRIESTQPNHVHATDATGISSTFTRRLAAKLGIDAGRCLATEGNKLITELTVKR